MAFKKIYRQYCRINRSQHLETRRESSFLEIWKQRKPIKNINKKIGMAKTVKNEKTKKMLLTANINQLVISKQLDKKSLTAWIMNFITV
ncbi:hypothetical protein [Bacillus sp. BA3]|uniref:hypothetical protein n=1 Tax=Bacillus sp. BA3 TaxID=2057910 RepID=UPI0012FE9476|nr:hypothetical protein [Bacillus sp. BA3]